MFIVYSPNDCAADEVLFSVEETGSCRFFTHFETQCYLLESCDSIEDCEVGAELKTNELYSALKDYF